MNRRQRSVQPERLRVVELYCGIGGCAAALGGAADVVAAFDINAHALEVYRLNFDHPAYTRTLESISAPELSGLRADLWWLSPPCQPYTRRGRQRDVDDPRAQSLLALLERLPHVLPRYLALENVPPFADSQTHGRFLDALRENGYLWQEFALCPSNFGVAARRARYYLVASRERDLRAAPLCEPITNRRIPDIVEATADPALVVPEATFVRYAAAMHVVDAADSTAVAQCFTSAYGRSPVRSGSYLRTTAGVRYFAPGEILRLLGFPADYRLPKGIRPDRLWPLVGNTLAIEPVRHVLASIPALAELAEHPLERAER